jgi:hypothetical protein
MFAKITGRAARAARDHRDHDAPHRQEAMGDIVYLTANGGPSAPDLLAQMNSSAKIYLTTQPCLSRAHDVIAKSAW